MMNDVEVWLDHHSGPTDICNQETIRCFERGGTLTVHATAGLSDRVENWIRAFSRPRTEISCATAKIPGQLAAIRGDGFRCERVSWDGSSLSMKVLSKEIGGRGEMKHIYLNRNSDASDDDGWYRTLINCYEQGVEITVHIDGHVSGSTSQWLEWAENLNSMSVLSPYCGRSHVYRGSGFCLYRTTGTRGDMEWGGEEEPRLGRMDRKRIFSAATRLALDLAIKGKYTGIQSQLYRLEDVSWDDVERLKQNLQEILEFAEGMALNLGQEPDMERVRLMQKEWQKI